MVGSSPCQVIARKIGMTGIGVTNVRGVLKNKILTAINDLGLKLSDAIEGNRYLRSDTHNLQTLFHSFKKEVVTLTCNHA